MLLWLLNLLIQAILAVEAARNVTVNSFSSGVEFLTVRGNSDPTSGHSSHVELTKITFGFEGKALYLHVPPCPRSSSMSFEIDGRALIRIKIPCFSGANPSFLWVENNLPDIYHQVSILISPVLLPSAFELFTYTVSSPLELVTPGSPAMVLVNRATTATTSAKATTSAFSEHIPFDLKLKLTVIFCGVLILLAILCVFCICSGDRQFRKSQSRPNSLSIASPAPFPPEPVITTTFLPDSPSRSVERYANLHYPPVRPALAGRVPVPPIRPGMTGMEPHGFREHFSTLVSESTLDEKI